MLVRVIVNECVRRLQSNVFFVICSDLRDNRQVSEWASELYQLLCRNGDVRYPTGHQNMRIPRDVVTEVMAEEAARLCAHIVEWCTEYITRN